MDIAFIAKRYDTVGGTERDLYELSQRLASFGHEVHIYCQEVRTETPVGITVHKLPVIGFGRTAKLWSLAFLVPKRAYEGGHDLVISFGRVFKQDIIRCGGGSHKVYLERISEAEGFIKRAFKGISLYHNSLLYIERKQFNRNNNNYRKVLAISEVVKRELIKVFGVPESDIEVIYDGIDTNLFSPVNKGLYREKVRKEFGIPTDAYLCLFLGNGFKRKGVDTLLKALSILNPPSPPFEKGGGESFPPLKKGDQGGFSDKGDTFCFIVGSDTNMNYYKRVVGSLGMEKKVVFAGRQMNPERFYAASDIFILPSLQEAFGNAVLEAMATGLPVITTRRAGAAEVLRVGLEQYVLEDPMDANALSAMIQKLHGQTLRESLSKRARQIAEGYSLDANAKAIEQLCLRVLKGKS